MAKEFRFLIHHKRKFVLKVLLVASLSFIVSTIIMLNIFLTMVTNQMEINGYFQFMIDTNYQTEEVKESLEAQAQDIGIILNGTSRTEINSQVIIENSTYDIVVNGIDETVIHYLDYYGADVASRNEPGDFEVIISEEMLEQLGLSFGDEIIFDITDSLSTSENLPNFTIVNTFDQRDIPTNFVFTNIETVDEISRISGTERKDMIKVFIKKRNDVLPIVNIVKRISNEMGLNLNFYVNSNLYEPIFLPLYYNYRELTSILPIYSIFVLVVYSILYLRMMSKRSSELKIYYYLGLRYYNVIKMFFVENLILISISIITGVFASFSYIIAFNYVLIDIDTNVDFGTFIMQYLKLLNLGSGLILYFFVITLAVTIVVHLLIYNYHLRKVRLNV